MTKSFSWDEEKNQKLIKERGISFEVIVSYIEEGQVVDIIQGKGKYSHQKQYIVAVNSYIYVVPFVEEEIRIFLKTIIPNRKLTRHFLGGEKQNEEN